MRRTIKRIALALPLVPVLALLLIMLTGRPCFGGGWYVGNTAAGEWIQYDNVWLTAGSYRFTANAGSPAAGALFHLEVDGVTVKPSVPVPNTGRVDTFAYVSLGYTTLSQGYHNLKIVFETSGVSLDWFMLRKDTDTTTAVKASDVTLDRPSTSGMLIAPVIAYGQGTNSNSIFTAATAGGILSLLPEKDCSNNWYSDDQMKAWYAAPMYEDWDWRTDRNWDTLVTLLLATRAQVPFMHMRSTKDFTHDLQDRGYQRAGGFEGGLLKKFSDAVARNPQAASSLQIGCFFEDGSLANAYFKLYGVYPAWGDSQLATYVMQYWIQPWFDSVPASMLYMPFPNSPIIKLWTNSPSHMVQDGQMGTFLTNIRNSMQSRYGLTPVFIVEPNADATATAVAWGELKWGTWNAPMYVSTFFNGINWGYSSAGSRERLDDVWMNDWDPATNTGTPRTCTGGRPGTDFFQSPLDADGNSVLLSFYNQATSAGTQLIVEEGLANFAEGNRITPSYGLGFNWPNQHIAAMRQYADVNTNSLKFEAEDCDQYYKTTTQENPGGTYRKEWYTSATTLAVYEPMRNLNPWAAQSIGPGNLVSLSAGFFDVWGLDASGQIWAHGIADGTQDSTWQTVTMPTGVTSISQLAVGKHFAWALAGNSVYTCELPYGSASNTISNGWTSISGTMANLAVDESNVWAADTSGNIFYMPVNQAYILAQAQPPGSWTQITGPGPAVNTVYAGGNSKFIWVLSGSNIYYTPTEGILAGGAPSWTQVANTYNLTQLSIGSQEVWGVNAAGNIYRRSLSGVGGWEAVDGSMTQIAVGENYAWALSGSTPYSRRLTNFVGASMASTPSAPTSVMVTAGNGSALLSWAPVSGAASYNVKRATVSGGPYTTVVNSTASSALSSTAAAADSGLTNGTTYYYVVTAVNGVGESANSTEVSVVPTASGTVPAVPTGLSVTGQSCSISLSWTASSGATSFNVKRSTVFGGPYTTIATGVASGTVGKLRLFQTYVDANVNFDTPYYYVVSAVNATGESFANSGWVQASATGNPLDRSAWVASASVNSANAYLAIDGNITTKWATGGPQTPGQWFEVDMGSAQSFYKLALDATPSPSDYPRGYQVNVSNDGVNWGSPIATGTGSSAVTTIIFPTQTARYFMITQTGSANGYWSIPELNAYAQCSAPPPPAPTGLTATAASSSQINLSWTASSGATSYNVLRSTTSGGPYTSVATGVTTTSYSDTGLTASTTYYYVVLAVNSGGTSPNSNQASATTLAPPPPAPTGLAATPGNAQVSLSWNVSSGATSYNVKRSTTSGGPYTTVSSPTTTSYTDTGLTNGTTYYYVVSAVNAGGESANSSQVSATAPSAATEKVDGTTGIPMGGVGAGAVKFCANNGNFTTAPYTPAQRSDFAVMKNTYLQFYSQRGGTVNTSSKLVAVSSGGRYDDDAFFPVQYANFGVTNGVGIRLTCFSPIDFSNLDRMARPYAFFEIEVTNTQSSAVDVACAFQLETATAQIGVAGKGIRSSGGVEYAVYGKSSDAGAIVSYGSDNGFFTSGQCNNTVSGMNNRTSVKVTLAGNETKYIQFVLAWYNGVDGGTNYTDRYYYFNTANNAGSFADLGLTDFLTLKTNATTFANKMRASNVPEWLKNQTMNSLCNLANNWVYTKDGRMASNEGQWQHMGTMDQMWHSRPIFIMLNPDMIWKELQYWARTQKTSPLGQIHHDFDVHGVKLWTLVGWDDQQHADYRVIDAWPDLNCGFITSVYEAFIATDDQTQLAYFWPYVKKAGQRILDQSATYVRTDYPYTFQGSGSSYDAGGNSDPYNSGVAILAYKIMSELCAIEGDTTLKATYDAAFNNAKTTFQNRWLDSAVNSFPYGRISEGVLAGQELGYYLKFDQFFGTGNIDYGISMMSEYYDPIYGMGYTAGTYNEWAEYMVIHFGGLLMQTGHAQEWRAMQYDYYKRCFLNRNMVFNVGLGIPADVTTPNYVATNNSGKNQYISYPDLWRNYFDIIGYHRNKHSGELWIEPKLPDEMNHVLTDGMFISPEGFGSISYTESGSQYQNQNITVKADTSFGVTNLYVKDTCGTNVTSVKVNGVTQTFSRIGTGYAKRIKINWSGTITAAGITIEIAGDAPTAQATVFSAFNVIEAKNYDSMSGVSIQPNSDNGGAQGIANITNGAYVVFNSVNFDNGADSLDVRVASASSGGNIEIRLDSLTGTLIGTCVVTNTGGWDSWATARCPISGVSGTHKVYFVFTGGSGYLFNINFFKFDRTVHPGRLFTATDVIQAMDYDAMFGVGVQANTDPNGRGWGVAHINNGDYILFNTVNFPAGISSLNVRVASANSGGNIEVRLDNTNGTLIGTCAVANTGGWDT